ncbi:hypothetical protein [Desulfonema magnum]|uniref:UvrC rIbonuclease H-like domain-containing protein n=1 Tax=Desulfonema magnum TaxID=45655 RepID=A0A975BX38_9BACT|nr:hypothetical protein [Desulfonema magnum]QTA92913.1 UvrC rIbonuclease H-like domain-containing protein [Desulfonema magnum]
MVKIFSSSFGTLPVKVQGSRIRKGKKFPFLSASLYNARNSERKIIQTLMGMVVFEKGKPDKTSYRKYKIRTVTKQDDYAYMAEVLKTRYGKGEKSDLRPDLLLVDDSKGQLNIAVSVLKELNIEGEFEVIGIAKKAEKNGETEDKIYKPGRANSVNMAEKMTCFSCFSG